MKFFSSFDTKLKQSYLDHATKHYGEEHVVIISRSKLYLFKKVILPVFNGFVLSGLVFTLIYRGRTGEIAFRYGFLAISPIVLLFAFVALENYIDYSMNYAIFTPDEAILVEQIGLFKRKIKTLNTNKIKSISIKKTNFIYSLFDDGVLTILNEGSSSNQRGEIVFKYVHNPELLKEKIYSILYHSKDLPIEQ